MTFFHNSQEIAIVSKQTCTREKKKKKDRREMLRTTTLYLKVLVNLEGHVLSPPTIITITNSSSRLNGSAGALTGGVVVEVTPARPRLAACHPAPLPVPAS